MTISGSLDDAAEDAPLPTFALLARLSGTEPTAVARQLDELGLHAEVVRPIDSELVGHAEVLARFIVTSLDGETALTALDEQLRAAGLPVDEVWLDRQV